MVYLKIKKTYSRILIHLSSLMQLKHGSNNFSGKEHHE